MRPFVPEPLPRQDLDWAALVPLIGRANRALALYDGLLQSLVNPEILLAPLGRREAVLSSRIEGTQASLRDVLEFEADPGDEATAGYADILEIINYRKAMRQAVDELSTRPLSLNLLKRAHYVLLDSVRGRGSARGEFRRLQVHIGPPEAPIERATYVPPPWTELDSLLGNFERYLHAKERDPVVQAGVIHGQFELIHPFYDGNGRVGRMLVPLFLYSAGAISAPAFYLSAYLESHHEEYFGRLQALSRSGDWQGWVEFFLRATIAQAEEDIGRARRIRDLYDLTKRVLAEKARSQFTLQMLDPLFTAPIISTPQLARSAGAPRASVARVLAELTEAGVLSILREGRGRRAQIYAFPALLDIVETEPPTAAGAEGEAGRERTLDASVGT